MSKLKIEFIDGTSSTILVYKGKTFSQKCEEIVSMPFYITMSDEKDSTLIARDKIIRIINLGP